MNDLILKARLHEQEQSVSYQLQNNFSIDKGLLENYNAGQYNQQSPVNTRVQSGGAVKNAFGEIKDGVGAAIAGKNPFNAGNRAEVQRNTTRMTPEQQSNMVAEQNKTLERQRNDSQIAGQDAARIKLTQNAPGVSSQEDLDYMGNIRSGQDPSGSQTGSSTTSFMSNFAQGAKTLAQGVGNVVGAGVDAYNNATQTNSGTGSAGQGIPQASPPLASTTGTETNQEEMSNEEYLAAGMNPAENPPAQNQQYNLGEEAKRAFGNQAITDSQTALTEAKGRANTKGGFATNPYLGVLTGGISNVLGAGYNAYKRNQGRQDVANVQNRQQRLMAGNTSAIQASEDILEHYYGVHKSRLEITDRGSTEAIRLAYR
jgi:hypothetical protein